MIPVKPIDPDDLPLYAMQLLTPEQMEELTLQLQHSVEGRKVLSEVYGDLSLFAQSTEMHAPPTTARQRLMKHVAREKKVIPQELLRSDHLRQDGTRQDGTRQDGTRHDGTRQDGATPIDSYTPGASALPGPAPRSAGSRIAPWLGWAIAASVGAFAFTEHQANQNLQSSLAANRRVLRSSEGAAEAASAALNTIKDPAAVHATLTSAEIKPLPSGRVSYVADKGSLVFLASNLAPLESNKTYELWVIPADGRDPVPAGTFKPDEHGYASVIMPELMKGVPAKAFGVTIENAEGSASPTPPILLKGAPS